MRVAWHNRPGDTGPPVREDLKPITRGWKHNKPLGGLWTSPAEAEFGWREWCQTEMRTWLGDRWEAESFGNLFLIDSVHDYDLLDQVYGTDDVLSPDLTIRTPDFPRIAEDFDGIYLTHRGLWQVGQIMFEREFDPGRVDFGLYGWDCETVLWFRWCFEEWVPNRTVSEYHAD